MFPFDIEDAELDVEVEDDKEPSDYEIDFETGKLTGRIITGLPAIKQWVMLVLGTDKYYYTQYSWDHGCELRDLIGKGFKQDYIESEVKRIITDALSMSKDIKGISNLEVSYEGDTLTAAFTLDTIYGSEEVMVDV
jgi:hypothetical protein